METGKHVQILLSTYNGESYLKEQLESILALERSVPYSVLIRDDGSTDGTKQILEEYRVKYGFQIAYGRNWGTTKSYEWLIRNSDPNCDYFAFSDQDDVWLPNKLTIAVIHLAQIEPQTPALFASRTCITDQNLHPIGISALPSRGISFYNAMVQNILPGHTQVFNRSLRILLAERGVSGAHVIDWWMYLVASSLGQITFSDTVSVLHRQHTNNSIGYRVGFLNSLQRRLTYLTHGKAPAISSQLCAFWGQYGDLLPSSYRDEVWMYLEGLSSFSSRRKYLHRSNVFRQKKAEDIVFRLLYLLGIYNFK